ncbi:MAG TPA: TonB-dependent receptor, partial [Gemmatimonadaceae bacterium]|nr:TonB-dependent receptor [Gemmatimonadaceae bacterium]
ASRSHNIGVELGVTDHVAQLLEWKASYAYLDMVLDDYRSSVITSTGARQLVNFSGKRLPGLPRHHLNAEVQLRPLPRLGIGAEAEWQSTVYVETSNAREGMWYFPAGNSIQKVPFRALPSSALFHMNAEFRIGPGTLFGKIENVFRSRRTANVVTNEAFGRFYEPGSGTRTSVGLRMATTHD